MNIILRPDVRQWVVKKTKKTDENIKHYLVIRSDISTEKEQGVTNIPIDKKQIHYVQTMLSFCIIAAEEYGEVVRFPADAFFTFIREERFKEYELYIYPLLSFFEQVNPTFHKWLQYKYDEYNYTLEDLELGEYIVDRKTYICKIHHKNDPRIIIEIPYCSLEKSIQHTKLIIKMDSSNYSYTTEMLQTEKIHTAPIQQIFKNFIENHTKLRMQLLLS